MIPSGTIEREREGEDRAGGEARHGERQDHPAQGRRAAAAEVGRRLDEGVRHALERGVDRQHHEREPDVGEDDPHRPVRVGDVEIGQPEPVEEVVERAVRIEDQAPRVDAHEVADPERQRRRDEEREAQPRACMHVTVTADAITSVRRMIVGYGSLAIARKLSRFQEWIA